MGSEILLTYMIVAEFTHPYRQLPSVELCREATKQASEDYRQAHEMLPWIRSYSPHRFEEAWEIERHAYHLWDAWYFATRLREGIQVEDSEHALRCLIGDDRFRRGDIPLPISWR